MRKLGCVGLARRWVVEGKHGLLSPGECFPFWPLQYGDKLSKYKREEGAIVRLFFWSAQAVWWLATLGL